MNIINSLPSQVVQKIGAILLGSRGSTCKVRECRYGIFSGTLIKTEIASKVCCRDDFFLDQADFDMCSRIRDLGLLTLIIDCKLVDHRLGQQVWIPIISHRLHKPVSYEPPWRYYYIVRNSTRLLVEGKMDVAFYVYQLIAWGTRILLKDGVRAFVKSFALGLVHGLVNRLGYLNPEVFKNPGG